MRLINRVIGRACEVMNLPLKKVEVSVHIVSKEKMRLLNGRHRGKNKSTDVLSFPLLTKREISTLKKKHAILPIGDIFINRSDAKQENKLAFLVTHGFLHLLGYDHERSLHQEKIMFAFQDRIMQNVDPMPTSRQVKIENDNVKL